MTRNPSPGSTGRALPSGAGIGRTFQHETPDRKFPYLRHPRATRPCRASPPPCGEGMGVGGPDRRPHPMTRIAPHTRLRARALRAAMTPQERRLWTRLRAVNRMIVGRGVRWAGKPPSPGPSPQGGGEVTSIWHQGEKVLKRLTENALSRATLAQPGPFAPPLPLVGRGRGWGTLTEDRR